MTSKAIQMARGAGFLALFQDTAGLVPVTANGDPVRRIESATDIMAGGRAGVRIEGESSPN